MKAKANTLVKSHPYIFFTLQLDSAWGLPKTYHKFTTWQFMAAALFPGHFLLPHGNEASMIQQYAL